LKADQLTYIEDGLLTSKDNAPKLETDLEISCILEQEHITLGNYFTKLKTETNVLTISVISKGNCLFPPQLIVKNINSVEVRFKPDLIKNY
jgi:hypothetical protein